MSISKTKQISRVVKFYEEIEWLFGLGHFERTIIEKEIDRDNIVATVEYDEKYQRIFVDLYPLFFTKDPIEQRKYLLHELCHCITYQLKKLSLDLRDGKVVTEDQIKFEDERATSKLENIFDGFLRGKLKYAKQAYKNYLQ